MSITAIVRALVSAGATPDMILAAVEAAEAANDDALTRRRKSDAERQQRRRDHVMSRDVTVTERDPSLETKVPPTPPSKTQSHPSPSPPKGGSVPTIVGLAKPNGFARFWEAYPSKVGKRDAEKAYCRALKRVTGPDPPQDLLAGVERAKLSRRWIEGYIPNPATWLNQDRWEDQPDETPRNDLNRPSPPSDRSASRTRVWTEAAAIAGRARSGGQP